MPEKLHPQLPIHSENVLPFIQYLYFFPEGGFFPTASVVDPGMERLIDVNSRVMIGGDLVEYKENSKFINKVKVSQGNVEGLEGENKRILSSTSYANRHTNTIGK